MHCVHCADVSPLSFDPRQIREWNKNIFVLAHCVLSSIHLHNRTQNNTLNKIFFLYEVVPSKECAAQCIVGVEVKSERGSEEKEEKLRSIVKLN